ncbi:MAG: hypothetical protein ACREU6_03810 [Steroidobacteraceae bacterium]
MLSSRRTREEFGTPDPAHSAAETRYLGIGPTASGRHVLVAFA